MVRGVPGSIGSAMCRGMGWRKPQRWGSLQQDRRGEALDERCCLEGAASSGGHIMPAPPSRNQERSGNGIEASGAGRRAFGIPGWRAPFADRQLDLLPH